MAANTGVYVSLEFTPNPNTLKYSVNRDLLARGAANFTRAEQAKSSPLAVKLFGVPGIAGVMIGKNFVTVTKSEAGDWESVHKSCSTIIEQHLSAGEKVLDEEARDESREQESGTHSEADGQIVRKIREILDNEIRPAVAMDGGDITFEKFENGVVYLYMQGSCAGCPSSTATLKTGIETRLKQAVPEVQEVVSL